MAIRITNTYYRYKSINHFYLTRVRKMILIIKIIIMR
jgi:hypothetical protein